MRTRSSPSLASLRSWAIDLGLTDVEHYSKEELYRKLEKDYDLVRYRRILKRRRRRHARRRRREQQRPVRQEPQATRLPVVTGEAEGMSTEALASHTEILPLKRKRCDQTDPEASPAEKINIPRSGGTMEKRNCTQQKLNELDPIMLTELTDVTFTFTRSNGTAVVYNVESLVDYFLHTGDFTEPETRIEFSDSDLKKLDFLVKEAGLPKQSVYEAKYSPQKYAEKKFKKDALLGLERVAGDLVCEMMEVIECCDPEEGEIRLLVNIFPLFADLYRQLEEADEEYAEQCLNHWKHYLKGPRNRPTKDYYGFLPIIMSFLDRCGIDEES